MYPCIERIVFHVRVILYFNGTFFDWETVPYNFPLVVLYLIQNLFSLKVHAWRYCLHLNEEQPTLVCQWAQTHFSTSWHAKMSLTLKWTDKECITFNPPHNFWAFTKYLPNIRYCIQNKQLLTETPVVIPLLTVHNVQLKFGFGPALPRGFISFALCTLNFN